MKFYIDFEATQFSNRIISIGCVTENDAHFNTLVKPVTGKVTDFITKLTGITNEMLEDAPTADEAFLQMRDWVKEVSDGTLPIFYAYGTDWQFIDSTVKYMKDFEACLFAAAVKGLMVDYTKTVTSHFCNNKIGLRSLVAMIESRDDIVQHHDALEDANWLKLVDEKLDTIPTNAMPQKSQNKPKVPKNSGITSEGPFPSIQFNSSKREPEEPHSWDHLRGGHHWEVPNTGDENNWVVRAWNDNHEIFFKDPIIAVYWGCKLLQKHSVKKATNLSRTWKAIKDAAVSGNKCYGVFWEIKPMKQEEKENEV